MHETSEIHQGEAAVVASIVENGPRSAAEVSDDLWPGGMTVSRRTANPLPSETRSAMHAGSSTRWPSDRSWKPEETSGIWAVRHAPARLAAERAVGVGLPAAIEPGHGGVNPTNPQRWAKWSISSRLAEKWASLRREDADALPPFPRLGDAPAVCVDADVVMDTLAAMHPLLGERLAPALARPGLVLGVKHSGGMRSTLINRGAPLVGTAACRIAGERRDGIFRGASGDTVGLGHIIALVTAARAEHENDPDFEDVERFSQRLVSNGHACACGETRLPHLDNLVAARRVAERLGLEIEGGRSPHLLATGRGPRNGGQPAWRSIANDP